MAAAISGASGRRLGQLALGRTRIAKRRRPNVLLISEVLGNRDEDIEFEVGSPQQRAVLQLGPAALIGGYDGMLGTRPTERDRSPVGEQDPQATARLCSEC